MNALAVYFAILFALEPSQDAWRWREVRSPTRPRPRAYARMAYDAARTRIVLFGGSGNFSAPDQGDHRDTWEWTGARWLQRTTPNAPPHRKQHALAYDSRRQRVVLFGGVGSSSSDFRGDTWEWTGTAWVHRDIPGPSPRADVTMAYDSARGVMVLFGGETAARANGETWLYDGASWQRANPVRSPPALLGAAMAWDPRGQRVLLAGGSGRADTWAWDGREWIQLITPRTFPLGTFDLAMVYDPRRQRHVLFGVDTLSVWEFDGTSWSPGAVAGPFSPRTYSAVAYDGARQQMVMFGGGSAQLLGDTWVEGPPR